MEISQFSSTLYIFEIVGREDGVEGVGCWLGGGPGGVDEVGEGANELLHDRWMVVIYENANKTNI